ncbi:MAG: flagellar motor protein [Betaproteobacteria bacterium]|nr:flagellar motor protein [Betaproteobacteria bacterium]
MDRISIAGLVLGVLAVVGGQALEGGHLSSLLQPAAFFIVIGGTLSAVMLQSPLPVFLRAARMGRWVFRPPLLEHEELIRRLLVWAQIARKDGMLALQPQLRTVNDEFVRKGLQLLIDGASAQHLRGVLVVEINAWEEQMKLSARVWEAAAGYAPTIGILGAVLGLIQVMENLQDPSRLGPGIAVAFIATIYGVGTANLLFLPVARKLLANVTRLVSVREMLVDGLMAIANGDNPRLVETRLRGYVV